jgi:hypothetical protein
MKKVLRIEPAVQMSAVDVEVEILAESGDKILSKNWKGDYIQLTPSFVKDDKTIYRVEDQALDVCMLKKQDWRKEMQC